MFTDIIPFGGYGKCKLAHIYQGYIRSFSAGGQDRELVLELVQVYDLDTAEKVGEIPILYLAFKKDDLVLEFRPRPNSGDNS